MSSKKNWILPTNEEFIREFAPELLEMPGQALSPIKLDGKGTRPTVFNFALDMSGSMSQYYRILVESFNQTMIPSLRDVQMADDNPLLVGGTLFSSKLIPMWHGFDNVNELSNEPLALSLVNTDGLRGRTALYKAMISALLWTHGTMEQIKRDKPSKAGGVQGKVCILTDGANTEHPKDAQGVLQVLNDCAPFKRSGKRKIQATLAFIKTDHGLSESQAKNIAKQTGFKFSGFYDLTEGADEQARQKMFRHAFDLWSKGVTGS